MLYLPTEEEMLESLCVYKTNPQLIYSQTSLFRIIFISNRNRCINRIDKELINLLELLKIMHPKKDEENNQKSICLCIPKQREYFKIDEEDN